MRIQQLLRLGAVVGAAMIIVVLIWDTYPNSGATNQATGQTQPTAQPPCPEDLSGLSGAEDERCGREKERRHQTAEARQLLTAAALPTTTPDPVMAALLQTPIPATASDLEIKELLLEAKLGAPPDWQDATSIWRNGSVRWKKVLWTRLYLLARPGKNNYGRIQSTALNGIDDARYDRRWVAPVPTGTIRITNATGPGGIVSFSTSLGQTGTLDTTTSIWTINGVIYQAAPYVPQSNQPYPAPAPTP